MLHINSHQVDSHCWILKVTDGYSIQWNATFNGFHNNLMVVRQGNLDYTPICGEVNLEGSSEAAVLGDAVMLLYNWAQLGPQCNETLNTRWRVLNEHLLHHMSGG